MEVKFMVLRKPLLINSDPLKEENCWLQKEILFRKIEKAFLSLETRDLMKTLDLTALHTLFMREHNRFCDQIALKNKIVISDEQAYHMARNYVIALLQKVTY